jgi:putative transposase
VRSAGGWSAVKALRRRGAKLTHDERILGDSQFVEQTIACADQRLLRTLRLVNPRPEIAKVCRGVCERFTVSEGELCSGSRRRPVVAARAALSWVAVRELGYSGAEVARFLGVTNSCVTRTVAAVRTEGLGDLKGLVEAASAVPTA